MVRCQFCLGLRITSGCSGKIADRKLGLISHSKIFQCKREFFRSSSSFQCFSDACSMGLDSTLPFKTSAGRRYQLCVMSSTQGLQTCSSSGRVLLGGGCLKMSSRKKITKGIVVGTIRSESPTLGDDEPKELRQGAKSTASSFRKTNHLPPLAVDESAQHVANKTAEEDCGPQGHRVTFSNLSDGSIASPALHLASKLSEKAEAELTSCKSKKPKRLSTVSWDLLD